MSRSSWALVGCLVVSVPVSGQTQQGAEANPLVSSTRSWYEIVKGYVTKSADLMTEENFAFRPTPEVRTFGQLIAHVADANYLICSAARGDKNPRSAPDEIEKTKTTKADLAAALRESFAYCDRAYEGLTDTAATVPVSFGSGKQPRVTILAFEAMHTFEHYGNMVTYMRLKGLVPPSTAAQQRPSAGQ